jgi:hypothetical protein
MPIMPRTKKKYQALVDILLGKKHSNEKTDKKKDSTEKRLEFEETSRMK